MSPRLRNSLSASLPGQNRSELPLTDTFVASVMRVSRLSLLLWPQCVLSLSVRERTAALFETRQLARPEFKFDLNFSSLKREL